MIVYFLNAAYKTLHFSIILYLYCFFFIFIIASSLMDIFKVEVELLG